MRLETKSILIGLAALAAPMLAAESAQAADLVTYTWTTTSQGFGPHVGQPTSATFQVALSDVQSGVIEYSDITNIQLTYPGLTFDSAFTSIIGFDFAAYVDPVTGAFIFHDNNQGLAVIAVDSTDVNQSTFLSILVDNPVNNAVKDQFNAVDHGTPVAGFPTAGYWTASFPAISGAPEPASWALMISGFGLAGAALRRRKALATAA